MTVAFATAAHAQGTIDFSGANTLLGNFKTFAIFAGAVIASGSLTGPRYAMSSSGPEWLTI